MDVIIGTLVAKWAEDSRLNVFCSMNNELVRDDEGIAGNFIAFVGQFCRK